MNQVTITYQDKNEAGLVVNNYNIGIGKIVTGYKKDGFTPRYSWIVQLSNIHNQSAPIKFIDNSLIRLTSKLEKHPYQLVR